MFLQFKKLNNESGVVLFIVLMVAIVIMMFSVGILTQSMNEMNYAQHQIDQINNQEVVMGAFSTAYSTYTSQGSLPAESSTGVSLTSNTNAGTGVTAVTFNTTYY